jgi:P27 family predicted phage terminase small subunit
MGSRGPSPKPTALRILQGNPGKIRLNGREPQPAKAPPVLDPPSWMDKEATEAFKRLRPQLPWLTFADLDLFTAYCVAYSRWREAETYISQVGVSFIIKGENGEVKYIQQRPEVAIAKNYFAQMHTAGAALGLSPAARTRIHSEEQPPSDEEQNEKRFFG